MAAERSLKLILPKECPLAFFGLCVDGIIVVGICASLAIIGVFVRLMGKAGIRKRTSLYEIVITLGRVLGNILDIYEFPTYTGPYPDTLLICAYGLSVGIFVDCLVVPLAEIPKALPIVGRRIHLAVGLQYPMFILVVGKMAESLVYFRNCVAPLG